MLQQERADDYVLASGVGHTVAELAERRSPAWASTPSATCASTRRSCAPPERTPSVGDPTKARERLGWEPRVDFEELVERMVHADLRSLREPQRPRRR